MNEKLNAPIQKGDKIGTLTIKKDNKVVSSSPLLAKEDIDVSFLVEDIQTYILYFLSNIVNS